MDMMTFWVNADGLQGRIDNSNLTVDYRYNNA
jgi:hypothetical protein